MIEQKSTVPKIEALVDAIGLRNGIDVPSSLAYQLRSPLLIKSFAKPGKHILDTEGRRVFPSMLSGYKAAVYDMELKVSGKSRAGLKPTDKLRNLLGVYGIRSSFNDDASVRIAIDNDIKKIVTFLRHALKDQSITANTELSYFIENTPNDDSSNS